MVIIRTVVNFSGTEISGAHVLCFHPDSFKVSTKFFIQLPQL